MEFILEFFVTAFLECWVEITANAAADTLSGNRSSNEKMRRVCKIVSAILVGYISVACLIGVVLIGGGFSKIVGIVLLASAGVLLALPILILAVLKNKRKH